MEQKEDYQILSSKIIDFNLINQKKTELERMYSTHDLRSESISLPNLQHYGVSLDSFDEPKYKQHLKESFDKINMTSLNTRKDKIFKRFQRILNFIFISNISR